MKAFLGLIVFGMVTVSSGTSSSGVNNPVCGPSACYITYIANKATQCAVGSVEVNQQEAKGTLTFGKIWSSKKTAWLDFTPENVKNLFDLKPTIQIAARGAVEENRQTFENAFQYPAIVVRPFSKIEGGFEFNFGIQGKVEFVHKITKTLDVYFDEPSRSLTFIGKDNLDSFELFRLASKKANESQAQLTGNENEYKVEMKLFDSKSKLIADISVSDSLSPSDGAENVFKNEIFQYNYAVLKTY